MASSTCIGFLIVMKCFTDGGDVPVVVNSWCQTYEKVRVLPSRKDTLETRRQIAIQETVYKRDCVKQPRQKAN